MPLIPLDDQADKPEKLRASAANVEAFIEKAKRFTTIDKLTPELVRLFIQRIEIGERAASTARSLPIGVGSTCVPVNSNRTVLGGSRSKIQKSRGRKNKNDWGSSGVHWP